MKHINYISFLVILLLFAPFVHAQLDDNLAEWETKFESVASGVETGLIVPYIALRVSEVHFIAISVNKSGNIDYPRIFLNATQTPLGYIPLAASVDDGWRLSFRSVTPANLTYARIQFRVNMDWMDANAGAEQVAVYRYVTNESVEQLRAKWIKNFTTVTGRYAYFETETNSTGLFMISITNKILASKNKEALPEGPTDVEPTTENSTTVTQNDPTQSISSEQNGIIADGTSTNNSETANEQTNVATTSNFSDSTLSQTADTSSISPVVVLCVDNCTDWTNCVNKTQKRNCAEICNANETPVIQQDCVPPTPQAGIVSAAYLFVAAIVLVGLFLLVWDKVKKKE